LPATDASACQGSRPTAKGLRKIARGDLRFLFSGVDDMNLSLRRAVFSTAVLLSSAAILLAQQPQPAAQPRPAQPRVQPGQPTQPAQPGQFGRQPGQPGAQNQQLEPSIVTLLIIDNNKEIALGQLGEQTTDNEDIKHFCQMIAKDHSNFVQKLQERSGAAGRNPRLGAGLGAGQPLAGQPAAGRPATATQPRTGAQPREAAQPDRDATAQQDQDRQGTRQQERTTQQDDQQAQGQQRITVAKPVIGNQPGAQVLQLCQEVAEKCLDTARKDAEKHKGADFDKHFMAAQVVAHKEMLDKLQVFQQHVSQDTAQLLADAQETTQKHLEEAKSICEQLEKQGSREGAGESRTRTQPRENRENRENQ
jgi:predicted outer membrane protein